MSKIHFYRLVTPTQNFIAVYLQLVDDDTWKRLTTSGCADSAKNFIVFKWILSLEILSLSCVNEKLHQTSLNLKFYQNFVELQTFFAKNVSRKRFGFWFSFLSHNNRFEYISKFLKWNKNVLKTYLNSSQHSKPSIISKIKICE